MPLGGPNPRLNTLPIFPATQPGATPGPSPGRQGIFPLLLGCFCSFSVGLFRFLAAASWAAAAFLASRSCAAAACCGPSLARQRPFVLPGLRINLPSVRLLLSIQRSLSLAFAGGGCLLGGGCFRVSLFLRCRSTSAASRSLAASSQLYARSLCAPRAWAALSPLSLSGPEIAALWASLRRAYSRSSSCTLMLAMATARLKEPQATLRSLAGTLCSLSNASGSLSSNLPHEACVDFSTLAIDFRMLYARRSSCYRLVCEYPPRALSDPDILRRHFRQPLPSPPNARAIIASKPRICCLRSSGSCFRALPAKKRCHSDRIRFCQGPIFAMICGSCSARTATTRPNGVSSIRPPTSLAHSGYGRSPCSAGRMPYCVAMLCSISTASKVKS